MLCKDIMDFGILPCVEIIILWGMLSSTRVSTHSLRYPLLAIDLVQIASRFIYCVSPPYLMCAFVFKHNLLLCTH
jgi:hypothetical protein